jgi:hypothetical protein
LGKSIWKLVTNNNGVIIVGFLVGVKLELIKHKFEPEENPSYGEEESL